MQAREDKVLNNWLGEIFSTSLTREQISLIKDRSKTIEERINRLKELLSEKQQEILTNFKKNNGQSPDDYSFLNFSALDPYDFSHIIARIS